jgi:hypothetical protein
MTMTKIAFAALLLAGIAAAPAQAAATSTEAEFSPDGVVSCSFVADAGKYVCDVTIQAGASSLTLPQEGYDRRRISVIGLPAGTTVAPAKP